MNDALRAWLDDKTYLMNTLSNMGVDVVEVVRCKDCENYEHIVMAVDNEGNVTKECDFCNHWKRIMSEQNVNDFCSYGERKEQEHEWR